MQNTQGVLPYLCDYSSCTNQNKRNIQLVSLISNVKLEGCSSELLYRQVFCKELKMTNSTAVIPQQTVSALPTF